MVGGEGYYSAELVVAWVNGVDGGDDGTEHGGGGDNIVVFLMV